MVALKGINKVMSQGNLGLNPAVINRYDPLTSVFSVNLSQLHLKSLSVCASGSSSLQEPPVPRSPPSLHTWCYRYVDSDTVTDHTGQSVSLTCLRSFCVRRGR